MSTANNPTLPASAPGRPLLLLLALILLLPALLLRPPERQQELRVLISARNMVQSGDWLRPEFQNQPRYRKPPLPYWLSAAAMLPGPLTDSAPRARLPFLLVSLATLLTLHALTRSPVPPLLLLAAFGFWRYAPLAETDMINALGITLAMRGFQTARAPLTALGITASILSKGPAGLAIPLLTFLLLHPTLPRSPRWWLAAFLPPLLAGAAWLAFLLNDPHASAALRAELTDTFLRSPHRNPPVYYLYTLPAMLGAALLLTLPRLLPALTRLRLPQTPSALLPRTLPAAWFTVTLLLLTLTTSKQNHYTLMLLPPSVWVLAPYAPRKNSLLPLITLTVLLAAGADITRSLRDPDAAHARFLRDIRPLTDPAPALHVTGINSARFDFHLGRHVHNTDTATRALRQAAPHDAVVIIQPRHRTDLPDPQPSLRSADDPRWIRRLLLKP